MWIKASAVDCSAVLACAQCGSGCAGLFARWGLSVDWVILAARRFAFEADCWDSCISDCFLLTKVFRQVPAALHPQISSLNARHPSQPSMSSARDRSTRAMTPSS
jgi:hypothetical protein